MLRVVRFVKIEEALWIAFYSRDICSQNVELSKRGDASSRQPESKEREKRSRETAI